MNVERVLLDDASLEEYLRATPDPARALIRRLASGASPRHMVLGGEVAPTLLEDVLADLAARGAIRGVDGAGGADLLTPAVDAALAVLRGAPKASVSLPPNARPSVLPLPAGVRSRGQSSGRVKVASAAEPPAGPAYESFALSEPPPPSRPEAPTDGPPSSLEDAVMREISDCSPAPGGARVPTSNPPPIIEPSALRKRSSNPPADDEPPESTDERMALPSFPPDAVVPANSTSEETLVAPVAAPPAVAETPAFEPAPPPEDEHDTEMEAPYSSPFALTTQPLAVASVPPPGAPHAIEPTLRLAPAPVPEAAPVAATPPQKRSAWPFVLAFAVLGLAVGTVFRVHDEDSPRPSVPSVSAASVTPPPAPVEPVASAAPVAASASTASDDVPPGVEVPAGFGLVEVTAAASAHVRIDGAVIGAGPTASLVAAPGYHEVRIEQDAGVSRQVIEVRAGKTTRVRSAPTP